MHSVEITNYVSCCPIRRKNILCDDGHNYEACWCPCASCILVAASHSNMPQLILPPGPPDLQQLAIMFILHPAPSANTVLAFMVVPLCMPINASWHPDLWQLVLVVHQLAQTLYLHLWWLPSTTCTGGLVPSSTGTYTACPDCNLHFVVVVI